MNAEIEHGPAIEPVEGFRFAGLAAGIKASGALDLALLVADEPCPTAAVFTRNRVRAAPVLLAERRVRSGRAQAVLVNSGNANAATGEAGARAAAQSTRLAAEVLDIDPELVLPASTGVIGEPLPLEPFVEHLGTLAAALDAASAGSFAEAILTTDRGRKIAEIRIPLPGGAEGRLLAMGKGAGMIHPNMATTLVFVVTDLEADAETLSAALRRATERTFNRISVDGDTSTNDAIVLMASGRRGAASPAALEAALVEALGSIGQQIVADGEGAEHRVELRVLGAPDAEGARRVAETVATSLLVKTALHGCDPNWGRILAAAGRAGVEFDPAAASVRIEGIAVLDRGEPQRQTDAAASQAMQAQAYAIELDLAAGEASDHYLMCDLGHGYVRVNADYRS